MTRDMRALIVSMRLLALSLGALVATHAAIALNLGQAAPSSDGVIYVSQYPNGDKPIEPGATCPSGWTCVDLGDASGEIDEVSATEWNLVGAGTHAITDASIAYQDAGTGEVQLDGRITASYAGTSQPFAGAHVGLAESSADTSYRFIMQSLQSGATAVQCQYGANGSYTTVNGPSGQSRPIYTSVTRNPVTGHNRGFVSTDGSTWTQVCSDQRSMSDVLAQVGIASKVTTETLSATIDNIALLSEIDAYDESTDGTPPGGAPVLVTAIGSQSGTQGIAFSLDVSANFTGETSYSISGLPGGTGLSFNTSTGVLSGTPTASDVGTRNLTITAINGSGSTPDTFSLTISAAPPGDTFTIAAGTGTTTFNCAALGPGDIVQFAGGTHGLRVITNCTGSITNPIVIRNNPAAGSRTTIRKANGTSGGFVLRLDNMQNVVIDGTQKWSGAPAGSCGITMPEFTEGKTQCGIRLETDGSEPAPSAWIKLGGAATRNVTIKGVEVDGSGTTSGGGIGISCNDHAFKSGYSGTGQYTGDWREDITLTQNYLHDIGVSAGEGLYCGPNAVDDDLPLRRIAITRNLVEDTAREGINGKYWLDGPNYVQNNVVRRSGPAATSQNRCINIVDGGDVTIENNIVEECGGEGILHINNNGRATGTGKEPPKTGQTTTGPFYSTIRNNIVIRAGLASGSSNRQGIRIARGSNTANFHYTPVAINYNTIIDPGTLGIQRSNTTGTCNARNNIVTDATGTASNCTEANNRSGTTASQNFVNAGADNYKLTSSSPARNSASGACPATDFEGTVRPQESACDQGADEYAP